MGDNLSKPVTEKHTSTFETSHLRVGCCGMQGWRKNMEDAHVAQLNLEGDKSQGLFGVFDGHNGHLVAKYCGAHMSEELLGNDAFHNAQYQRAFEEVFEKIDETLKASPELRNEGGCTAVTVLLTKGQLICANAGDSRAVLARSQSVLPLSMDHKPTLPAEIARIEKAGGTLQGGRVNGTLALSRAIGDFDFKEGNVSWKEQMVTAFPDVTITKLQSDDEFLVIACDGVWDVISNEDCCKFISQRLQETQNDVGLVCEMLLDKCLAPTAPGLGCDNMTVLIVQFKEAIKDTF